MIRLSRRGARKQPVYRIVVIEKDRARDGRSIEVVGLYNPRTSPATIDLKRDRVEYWLSKGARFSPTLARLYKIAPAAPAAAAPVTPAVEPVAPAQPAE
jgi:small subunit ribosomal protein S16